MQKILNAKVLRFIILRKFLVAACFIIAVVTLFGCKTTKYVPDGSFLLDHVKIEGNQGNVSHDDILNYVRQRPNVRTLGFWRLNLDVYNLSRNKDNGFNNWLRRIGSAPVIYDSLLMERSREQIQIYLKNRGYFDAQVRDTMVVTADKKCDVTYKIDAGTLYRISRLGYGIDDDSIRAIIYADTAHCLLRHGDPFDAEVHDDERTRITRNITENGYYQFDKNYIYFIADSSMQRHWIADSLILMNRSNDTADIPHKKAIIDEIIFYVNRANRMASEMPYDSLNYAGYKIFYRDNLIFSPQLLVNSCFIKIGELYKTSDVESTIARFNSMKLFGSAGVRFIDKSDISAIDGFQHLRCVISLTTNNIQSYAIELEGTNSSGNLGGAANIRYSHANLLHHAETFNIKYRIASQNQFARDGKQRFYTFETGVEASLTIPKFLAPFSSERFIKHHNPTTILTASYDYQRRPDFTKSVVTSKIQYNWHQRQKLLYTFTPVEMNVVNIPTISENFQEYIRNTYLQYSYTDHFIMSMGFSFLFNPPSAKALSNAWYVNFNMETAGNVLSLLTDKQEAEEFKKIWNIRYAQYVKTNIELRYLTSDIWQNNFAYRFFAGIGIPYGNSKMLPFEKSFFVGGANSIRAWPVRGLGPGSSKSDSQLKYHNQISDIRLEMNAEYRFKLVSVLEGAIFADAGNIWALSRSTDDGEAIISRDFYKQIALGSGLGIRLNFDYFILRIDAAVKLHDPSAEVGHRWVIAENRFNASDVNYNFAIGYPF